MQVACIDKNSQSAYGYLLMIESEKVSFRSWLFIIKADWQKLSNTDKIG